MTKEQEDILKLSGTLVSMDYIIEEIKQNTIDPEWDNHHCTTLVIGDCIDDYQVLRHFDIEIDYINDPYEYAIKHLLTPEQQEIVCDDFEKLFDFICEEDFFELQYHIEYGEFMQQWINLKTGNITTIGKRCRKYSRNCDWNRKNWEIITPKMLFAKQFLNNYSGFYMDYDINPILAEKAYIGIDTTSSDWREINGNGYCAEFIRNTNMAQFIADLALNNSHYNRLFELYGMDEIMYIQSLDQPYQDEYKTALRIRRKNNYTPKKLSDWRDHIEVLYKLHKDLHNAYYVCPEGFAAAHSYWVDKLQKKEAKEALIQRIKEAALYEDKFRDTKGKYLGLLFTDNANFIIAPLQSVKDFADEGSAMHHCVYTNRYFEKGNSLIFSAKDMNGKRLATIEFDLYNYRIVQCRGINNSVPLFDDQIRACINDHVQEIKHLKNKKYRKTA